LNVYRKKQWHTFKVQGVKHQKRALFFNLSRTPDPD
jgi:hypothetical protein